MGANAPSHLRLVTKEPRELEDIMYCVCDLLKQKLASYTVKATSANINEMKPSSSRAHLTATQHLTNENPSFRLSIQQTL